MSYTYEKEEIGLLPEGDYEAVLQDMATKILPPPSGKEKIAITFRIRDDVEQDCKGRLVFEDIWKEKENPQYYNRKRLNKLLGTQTIEDGTVFETIEDIITFLKGAFLIVHVTKEFDEYSGQDRNRIAYYKPTKNGAQSIAPTEKTEEQPTGAVMDIPDDQLPF